MYNSKERITATDTTKISYNQKINKTFTVGEILTSPLWHIKNTEGNVVTAIPLFNCDLIKSFNDSDIVIDDNKAIIIIVDDEDIPIECISDNTGDINYHNTYRLYAYYTYDGRIFGDPTIYCIVYDECGCPIPNALIDVMLNHEYYDTLISDNEGLCRLLLPQSGVTITFTWHGFANTRSNTRQSNILTIGDEDGESNR